MSSQLHIPVRHLQKETKNKCQKRDEIECRAEFCAECLANFTSQLDISKRRQKTNVELNVELND
jgi:hypothetical protein